MRLKVLLAYVAVGCCLFVNLWSLPTENIPELKSSCLVFVVGPGCPNPTFFLKKGAGAGGGGLPRVTQTCPLSPLPSFLRVQLNSD